MAAFMIVLSTLLMIFLLVVVVVQIAKRFTVKLSVKRKRWWLFSHIAAVIVYFCGVLGALTLALLANFMSNPDLIYSAHYFIRFFDWFLIIPGAIGSLITGIWLSVRTNWGGLTQYYWILVKLVGNMAAITFGSLWIRQWIGNSIDLAREHPFHNPSYLLNHSLLMMGTAMMLSLLTFLVIISVFKPWGKRKNHRKRRSA